MALSFKAENNVENNTWEVSLEGDADIDNEQYLREQFEKVLIEKRQNIVIEMSKLGYMDSVGLAVIIKVYKSINADGYTIKVKNPRGDVKKLLKTSGCDRILCYSL